MYYKIEYSNDKRYALYYYQGGEKTLVAKFNSFDQAVSYIRAVFRYLEFIDVYDVVGHKIDVWEV